MDSHACEVRSDLEADQYEMPDAVQLVRRLRDAETNSLVIMARDDIPITKAMLKS